jgi:Tat protein translocase TatB subunit
MFGSLGGPELLFLFVLALLLFGPRKLPEIGRLVGRALSEFRRATYEFRTNLEREVELERMKEARDVLEESGRAVSAAIREMTTTEPERAAPEKAPPEGSHGGSEPRS